MKRVLIVASVASMIQQFNMSNIDILKSMGFGVDVACNFLQGNTISTEALFAFKKKLESLHIEYIQVDFSRNPLDVSENFRAYKVILSLLRQNKYEFVHCQAPISGAITRIAAKITKTPVIYTAHGFHFYKGAPLVNWLLYYPLEKHLSKYTDLLITINHEDYNTALTRFSLKRLSQISGVGIDTSVFHTSESRRCMRLDIRVPTDAILLVSVGELNVNKNHQLIIRAIALLARELNLYYCICGIGSEETTLRKLAQSLQIGDRLILAGYSGQIPQFLGSSDIFVFPSKREGLPVALIEAMASGLPVVCSKIRGNTDLIVNDLGGFLIEGNDVAGYANAIRRLAEDSELRMRMGSYNQQEAQVYDHVNVDKQMRNIYSSFTNRMRVLADGEV